MAGGTAARAGFSLIEVLVAIVIAALMVVTLSRALTTAWSGARAPGDVLGAVTVARDILAGMRAQPNAVPVPGAGRIGPYRYEVTTGPATLDTMGSPFPPAPGDAASASTPQAGAPPPDGQKTGNGQPAGRDAGKAPPIPLRIVVVVTAPSGRSVRLETVKLVPAGG
jgi:prepilin-type N-terminal cleavage/methylation domain-containing protein